MFVKNAITNLVLAVIVCLPFCSVQAQSRKDLINQLNQAKKEYYDKKQAIDDAISDLGRQWHMYQLQMYEEIKEDPKRARAIRAELWEGAKKLSRQKRALYDQLTPLRRQWYQTRIKIEKQIEELEKKEADQWD